MARRLGGSVVCALVFVVSTASARPEYAAAVGTELDICTPPCTLCHAGTPNRDNPVQPFVLNLIELARVYKTGGVNDSTLPRLLELMETESCERKQDPSCATDPCGVCNGDGSGEPDVEELRNSENPNDSGSFVCPEYGCGASVAPAREPRSHEGAFGFVALAWIAAFFVQRRRTTAMPVRPAVPVSKSTTALPSRFAMPTRPPVPPVKKSLPSATSSVTPIASRTPRTRI
jgi:MYXO-CTERM domain-containing protein